MINIKDDILFKNLPVGLIAVDTEVNIIQANNYIYKYFNIDNPDFLKMTFGNFFNCSQVAGTEHKCGTTKKCEKCKIRKTILDVLNDGSEVSDIELNHHFTLNGRNTSKWFTISASKIVENKDEMVLMAFTDITELKNIEQELFHLGITDELTGLYNRRHIIEKFESSIGNASLALAMIDIDKFKNVNDTYGHLTGDVVLKALSYIMKKHTRNTDYVGRYGGEEFLIIFNNANIEIATKVLKRIAKNFVEIMADEIEQKLTFSAGLISIEKEEIGVIENYIDRTDKLLYKAKENGRNRIETE